jgi:hypothetical protein
MSAYNGWTNRETWLVNLWFGEVLNGIAADYGTITARYIAAHVQNYVDEIVPTGTFISDLIDLDSINWGELAEHYKDESNAQ